jgi:hypothetical protein
MVRVHEHLCDVRCAQVGDPICLPDSQVSVFASLRLCRLSSRLVLCAIVVANEDVFGRRYQGAVYSPLADVWRCDVLRAGQCAKRC